MNKIEYLDALKEALKKIDITVMEEIVADYEEHFQVGLDNGKSEEQICEELGSIEDLAREIKEAYGTSNNSAYSGEANNPHQNFTGEQQDQWYYSPDGGKINLAINHVLKSTGEAINQALQATGEAIERVKVKELGDKVINTIEDAANRLNEFVETGYNRYSGAFGENPPQGESYQDSVTKSYDIPEPGNQKVNIVLDGICADIDVKESTDGKINIRYENTGNERQRQRYAFYSFMEGNTIYAGLRIVGNPVFVFNLKPYNISIHLEVPEGIGVVDIKSASGDVGIFNVKPERILTQTASGDISIRRVEAGELRIKSASGDILAEDASGMQINVGTSSGDIKAKNMTGKEISLKSTSGDVEAENIGADRIDYSSLSGDIDVLRLKTGQCYIKSTSGDIKVEESTMNRAEIISISGEIDVSRIAGEALDVKSTSGDVQLDVNVQKCKAETKSGGVEAVLCGDTCLESSSISGNVHVRLKNDGNGYSLKSRTVTGDLSVHYRDLHQRNLKTGTYIYGNQGSELVLSSVSGNIQVSD